MKNHNRCLRRFLFPLALAGLFSSIQAVAADYTITDFGALGRTYSAANGTSGKGQVVREASVAAHEKECDDYTLDQIITKSNARSLPRKFLTSAVFGDLTVCQYLSPFVRMAEITPTERRKPFKWTMIKNDSGVRTGFAVRGFLGFTYVLSFNNQDGEDVSSFDQYFITDRGPAEPLELYNLMKSFVHCVDHPSDSENCESSTTGTTEPK